MFLRQAVKPPGGRGFKIHLTSHNNTFPFSFSKAQMIKGGVKLNIQAPADYFSSWDCFLLDFATNVWVFWFVLFRFFLVVLLLKQEPGECERRSFGAFLGTLALQRQDRITFREGKNKLF